MQGPRAQADRKLYRQAMQAAILATPNLEVIEAAVEDLIVEDGAVAGIVTATGDRIAAGAVVLTTGTFLRGLIHIGEKKIPAGRIGEAPSVGLGERLYGLGLRMGRLKTGTPPRLDGRTIDFSALQVQHGDAPPVPFSFLTERDHDAADCLPRHPHDGSDAQHHRDQSRPLADVLRRHPERGPALLPLDRGQDRPLQGAAEPPDLPRAGRPRRRHRLSERHLDLVARRCAARLPQDHSRA